MKYLCHKQLKTWMWKHGCENMQLSQPEIWSVKNDSDFRLWQLHAEHITKKLIWDNFLLGECIFKIVCFCELQQTRYLLRVKEIAEKSMIVPVAYVHYILFRMQGEDTATEIIFLRCISDYTRVCPSSENKAKYSMDSTSY